MNTNAKPSKDENKTCFLPEQNDTITGQEADGIKCFQPRQRHRANSLQAVIKHQPAPRIPGISRNMVRKQVPLLIQEGVLNHRPKTISEWLLTEWLLARKLRLSPMRLAYCVSELAQIPAHTSGASAIKVLKEMPR